MPFDERPSLRPRKVKIRWKTHKGNRPRPRCVTLSPHSFRRSQLIRSFHSLFTSKLSTTVFQPTCFFLPLWNFAPLCTCYETFLQLVPTKRCDLSSRPFSLTETPFLFLSFLAIFLYFASPRCSTSSCGSHGRENLTFVRSIFRTSWSIRWLGRSDKFVVSKRYFASGLFKKLYFAMYEVHYPCQRR